MWTWSLVPKESCVLGVWRLQVVIRYTKQSIRWVVPSRRGKILKPINMSLTGLCRWIGNQRSWSTQLLLGWGQGLVHTTGIIWCFQKYWYPQIIHFNRSFPLFSPTIFGGKIPLFLVQHPYHDGSIGDIDLIDPPIGEEAWVIMWFGKSLCQYVSIVENHNMNWCLSFGSCLMSEPPQKKTQQKSWVLLQGCGLCQSKDDLDTSNDPTGERFKLDLGFKRATPGGEGIHPWKSFELIFCRLIQKGLTNQI